MSECAAQRGFLMFRECGNPAGAECGNCGRPMCFEHIGAGGHCLDCNAHGSMMDTPDGTTAGAYGFRHHFYHTAGYRPVGLDPSDAYYDEYDVRGFDSRKRHAALLDEEREPDFGDS
jgi:hypothetical protein